MLNIPANSKINQDLYELKEEVKEEIIGRTSNDVQVTSV